MTIRNLAAVSLAVVLFQGLVPSHAESARLEFTPVIARLEPLNSQVANSDAPLVIRESASTAFGARMGIWVAPRVGIEANLLVGSSSIQIIGNELLSLDATMLQADVRVRFRVTDPTATAAFDVIAGVGLSDLGDGLSDVGEDVGLTSPSTFTFVIGVGATIPITDRVRLRFDVEDHIHDSNFEIDATTFGYSIDNRTQNDLVFATGLVIPLQ